MTHRYSEGEEEEPSHNTSSTIPSYQSMDERMPRSVGGDHSRRSTASSLGNVMEETNNSEDVEMGLAVQTQGDGETGSWRRVSDTHDNDDDEVEEAVKEVAVVFPETQDLEEGDSGEEGGDTFGGGSEIGSSVHSATSSNPEIPTSPKYQWQLYAPDTKKVGKFLRWAIVGGSNNAKEQSDEELLDSLAGLARCLHLLREYLYHYGMPERGGPRDQELILREIIRDLYAGGAPMWALEPVMQKAAEGLTGQPNVNWQIYPRKAFVYNPSGGTTSMFRIDRGFNISKMSAMEGLAVRLASFASNVQGVSNIPARFPNPQEFDRIGRRESVRHFNKVESRSKLARQILNLASKQQGLFYYVNSREYKGNKDLDPLEISGQSKQQAPRRGLKPVDDFWVVTDDERELFSRLACQEALVAIDAIDAREQDPNRKNYYTPGVILLCRVMAAAGACAFWFGGSWQDMIVAGGLAIVVAFIGTSSILSKQERLLYEVIASFVVGLTAGLLALSFPEEMCFSAMAISGVLDLLQGFRVVYAIIEIMSRHTVSGGADLLEGILFTGLISYFLQFGSYVAAEMLGSGAKTQFTKCTNGIDDRLYFVLVPLAALSWATLFTPYPRDLPAMAFHGALGYSINYALGHAGSNSDLNYFVSASVISLSAGIFSRFTGRQAVGNTAAGMFMIVPGAYIMSSMYTGSLNGDFFVEIVKSAVIIGIGGWTGTILCSPTLLGTTRGLLFQRKKPGTENPGLRHARSNEDRIRVRPTLFREEHTRHLLSHPRHAHRSSFGNANGGGTTTAHRRKPSAASTGSGSGSGGGHHRKESTLSAFDFEHPASTMLFF